jgi:hypothetical protein
VSAGTSLLRFLSAPPGPHTGGPGAPGNTGAPIARSPVATGAGARYAAVLAHEEPTIEAAPGSATLAGMTSDQSSAYQRVVTTLRDMGPAKLWPAEQACVREAADALFFCADRADEESRSAFAAVTALMDSLVETERWTGSRAEQLLDDVWACGPGLALAEPLAA